MFIEKAQYVYKLVNNAMLCNVTVGYLTSKNVLQHCLLSIDLMHCVLIFRSWWLKSVCGIAAAVRVASVVLAT